MSFSAASAEVTLSAAEGHQGKLCGKSGYELRQIEMTRGN